MKYRKKPVVIEAFKYDGNLMGSDGKYYVPEWAIKALEDGILVFGSYSDSPPCELFINTLEGQMHAEVGDYVIRGIKGEFYPCKPDIFEQTYEAVLSGKPQYLDPNRHYVAISIKHTAGCNFTLWGYKRTSDDEERCFAGYTGDINKCEIYSLEDFRQQYSDGVIKCNESVKPSKDLVKVYEEYDTVLVDYDQLVEFLNN